MVEYATSQLDEVFGAVADPTRRAILARLATSEARVTEIAEAFPISLNATSKHIKVLERAGLVRRDIYGRDHVLSLNAEPMADAVAWMEFYRGFWESRLSALEQFVKTKRKAVRPTKQDPPDRRKSR
jgi:DNA-binding transcriptional ArsR family regulator